MSDKTNDFRWGMVVGGGLVLVFFLLFGGTTQKRMKRDAIQAGAGYYHPQTGEFTFGCTGGGTR